MQRLNASATGEPTMARASKKHFGAGGQGKGTGTVPILTCAIKSWNQVAYFPIRTSPSIRDGQYFITSRCGFLRRDVQKASVRRSRKPFGQIDLLGSHPIEFLPGHR